MVDIIDLCKKY